MIEAYQKREEEPKWQYSLSRLQVPEIVVKLNGRLVYKEPYTGRLPVELSSSMWTFEKGFLPEEKED